MSYDMLNVRGVSDRFSSLRQAPLGDRRAPHKPLLILLMLGRYQRGNFRSLLFEEAQDQLKELLFEFGPPSRSINVLDPFWRLQKTVSGKSKMLRVRVAETIAPPTATTLVDRTARGNFAPEIAAILQKQPAYIPRLARELLTAHFPQSLQPDICAAVGLELDNVPQELETEQRLVREADFRPRIIRAYEYRCAVTGWDLRVGHIEVGLEAAHIKWHSAGGPSVESNGIALNSLHHKLFDLAQLRSPLERLRHRYLCRAKSMAVITRVSC